MTSKALGLIETIGLVAAVEAADAAVKAAGVALVGYESAKGGGRIAVKLAGDVGAVKAAVAAGSAAAMRVGQVAACLVIPRPHDEIAALIAQIDRGQDKRHPESRNGPPPEDEAPPPEDEAPPPEDEAPPPEDEAPPPEDEMPPPAEATPPAAPKPERRKPAVKRGRSPKNNPPAAADSGEVEG